MITDKIIKFFKVKSKDKNKNAVIRNEISQRYKNPMDEADDWTHHSLQSSYIHWSC